MFLPVDSAMASAHNGILLVACNAECPDLQQLLLLVLLCQENNDMAISVKAETHVIILHTTRKFVTRGSDYSNDKQVRSHKDLLTCKYAHTVISVVYLMTSNCHPTKDKHVHKGISVL